MTRMSTMMIHGIKKTTHKQCETLSSGGWVNSMKFRDKDGDPVLDLTVFHDDQPNCPQCDKPGGTVHLFSELFHPACGREFIREFNEHCDGADNETEWTDDDVVSMTGDF